MSKLDAAAKNMLRTALVRAIDDATAYAAKLSADIASMDADVDRIRDALGKTADTRKTHPVPLTAMLAKHTEQMLLTLCGNRLTYRRYLAEVHSLIQHHRNSLAQLTDSN